MATPEIEVTPEMVCAGLEELREHHLGDDMAYVVESVFRTMAYASFLASDKSPSRYPHAAEAIPLGLVSCSDTPR